PFDERRDAGLGHQRDPGPLVGRQLAKPRQFVVHPRDSLRGEASGGLLDAPDRSLVVRGSHASSLPCTPASVLDVPPSRDVVEAGGELRAALRGDCHTHSDWSDGGSPIREMAETARDLGHEYLVLTDHSPRLTVARGLSAERLEQQLDVVATLNDELAPFRIL